MISYAITSHNETWELDKLLKFLSNFKDPDDDEIVILDDFSYDSHVEMIQGHVDSGLVNTFEQRALNKDFASQKNYLNSICKKPYIFNLDADEIPNEELLINIKAILMNNENVELFWIPRVNTVDGMTEDDAKNFRWRVDERGWINWPDPQARIYKNIETIQWVRPVPELVVGAKTSTNLPWDEMFALYHHKTIDKQKTQNNFYEEVIENVRMATKT